MASKALRQIFINAAQMLIDQGKREEAGTMVAVIRASDREEGRRVGRKKGERVTDKPQAPSTD